MPSKQLNHEEVMLRKPDSAFKVQIVLVLDRLIFQENIAGICRVADAMQVDEILLLAEEKLLLSKSFRSIARVNPRALRLLTYSNSEELVSRIEAYKDEGYRAVALEYTEDSQALMSWTPTDQIILVAGSERHGISDELLQVCTQAIHIPMYGSISSLNVNQAVSIALWDIRRHGII